MKARTTLTMFSAVIALGLLAGNANSQNHFSGPRNMGATLNMAGNDIAPVVSANGLSLYLTSSRPGGQGSNDIWVSQRATLNSAWGAPQNLGATVNSTGNDVLASFSLDGKTMFLQSNRAGGIGGRDNYLATRTDPNNDFGWTAPVNLGSVANSAFEELGATYFEDPTTGAGSIIFSSNRIGNPATDFHLYQSTRNVDGTFNAPTPIPELIIGGELRAAIRRDGLEIFVSATLPPAVPGALDNFGIWVSTRASISASWNPPVLVRGINTLDDEGNPSLSPDGSILYFHSTRAGGNGQADLYSATRCSVYSASPCQIDRPISDFNGDGMTDFGVFRPSDGTWWVMDNASGAVGVRPFGASGDKPVSGDYDGDGILDLAVFRPTTGVWWHLRSSDNSLSTANWGLATDTPVPGDYDGDGRTDISVYRDGTWYILRSSDNGFSYQRFGLNTDIPISGINVP